MGRARGESKTQAVPSLRSKQLADESTMDRFAEVFGTTRGSGRVDLPPEREVSERDAHLQRVVEPNGDVYYRNDKDDLHRESGPAVELADGTRLWYQNGAGHRVDGPAVENSDGTRIWNHHGILHRDNGPAIEQPDGLSMWYMHGQRHRIGGPAVIGTDGTREWWQKGYLHRIGEPAIEWADGRRSWYEHGVLRHETP